MAIAYHVAAAAAAAVHAVTADIVCSCHNHISTDHVGVPATTFHMLRLLPSALLKSTARWLPTDTPALYPAALLCPPLLLPLLLLPLLLLLLLLSPGPRLQQDRNLAAYRSLSACPSMHVHAATAFAAESLSAVAGGPYHGC
jgi:hypothetical protein